MKRPPDLLPIEPRHEITRRDALKLLGAGITALQAGCLRQAGDEAIVPYVEDPPERHASELVRYASVLAHDGFGIGIIVDTYTGRPVKIDGNPGHPAAAGGGSLPWLQASILDLYDPQRATEAQLAGEVTGWSAIAARLGALPQGALWLVLPPIASPSALALIDRIRAEREVHLVASTGCPRAHAYRGAELAFGTPLEVQLDLSRAQVVVALDANFLADGPMAVAWSRAFAGRRQPGSAMNRLWACEPVQTATGTLADESLAIPAGDVAAVATCLAAELAARGAGQPPIATDAIAAARHRLGARLAWVRRVADDLAAHRGAGAVIAGDRQPAAVHALARWIDHACGNLGSTVTLTAPAIADPLGGAHLADLAAALRAGRAPFVIAFDCDPVYTAPPALELARLLPEAQLALHVGLWRNATSAACNAFMPLAHPLETWSDARAYDGTLAIGQPALRSRFPTAGMLDVLAALAGDAREPRAIVYDQLGQLLGASGPQLEHAWQASLRAGWVERTRTAPQQVAPRWSPDLGAELATLLAPTAPSTIEIALAPSPALGDGRFAGNAWLQELPHPITKQTWGNAALMSHATARRLGVSDEDLVELATPAGRIALPAVVVPTAADDSITVELGYGQRTPAIPIANQLGANGYALRDDEIAILRGVAVRTGGTARVARTQHVMAEHGRETAPATTLAHLRAEPLFLQHLRGDQVSLIPQQDRSGVQWGMSIDTSICTGCSSCMVACQAENNIPTVGPDEVARGHHMNWIRIDRYVHDDGAVVNEPMPCQHCENAPCEYVCPVMATTHSPDGLNEQVYNRCIGTRFCSNNCPYKVRRFNWFAYEQKSTRALQYNPDVTVRSRGVMEKCTYCVQRIRRAEHHALVEHREIATGEVVTACQAACPTGAIQFGQLHEEGTPFARMRRDLRRFEVLHDLGTRPRTQYLVKVRNPAEGR